LPRMWIKGGSESSAFSLPDEVRENQVCRLETSPSSSWPPNQRRLTETRSQFRWPNRREGPNICRRVGSICPRVYPSAAIAKRRIRERGVSTPFCGGSIRTFRAVYTRSSTDSAIRFTTSRRKFDWGWR
jgi:hypothetical protein